MATAGFLHGGKETLDIERNRNSVFRGVEMQNHLAWKESSLWGPTALGWGSLPLDPVPLSGPGDASCPAHKWHISHAKAPWCFSSSHCEVGFCCLQLREIFFSGCARSSLMCVRFLSAQWLGATLWFGLLILVASLVAEHHFYCAQASGVVANGLSCSVACRIFPNQELNPCPLQWPVDS